MKLKNIVRFVLLPYINRLILGEGGLVIMNIMHAFVVHEKWMFLIIDVFISFFIMCVLYGFNDFNDRYKDLLNPKKQRMFVLLLIDNPKSFMVLNISLSCFLLFLSFVFFGFQKSLIILVLIAINIGYSKFFKSIPIVDVIAVSAWGGMFILLIENTPIILAGIVGIMTGIAHVFQILTDIETDRVTNINTSVVARPDSEYIIIFVLCSALFICLNLIWNVGWAFTAFLPFLISLIKINVEIKWHLSRMFFILCWIILITLK